MRKTTSLVADVYRYLGSRVHEFRSQAPVPCQQQCASDYHQPHTQSNPYAQRAPSQLESQQITHWQPDEPIRHQIRQHGRARIAGTAEGACRDHLQAIEHLERGCDEQ